ncbi:Uncharacterised protein [Bordetella pertussis]|nr:Uncharacterised protein [Bordetella pertussis]
MLELAKAARLAAAAHAQIELPHIGVAGQPLGAAAYHHLAGLHDVTVVRHRQRDRGVLLHQQHRDALLGIDARDDRENALDQHGRQAQRRLVQQHQAGLGDQRPAYRQHLLLAARQIARQPAAPLVQPREVAIHQIEIGARAGAPAQRVGGRHQVLLHGQVLEHPPPFHHVRQPRAHQRLRRAPGRVAALEADGAADQRAILQLQQARHRLQRGGLAGAVAAQQGHDAAARHLQRQAPQHLHGLVVDHFDVVDGQHRRGGCRHGLLNPARSNPRPAASSSAWRRRGRCGPPESNCP